MVSISRRYSTVHEGKIAFTITRPQAKTSVRPLETQEKCMLARSFE